MKVLITGSTANQASSRAALRVPTFASMIAEALSRNGDDVDFVEPSNKYTKHYLSVYDVVLVGIAPPTSIAANKVYPAFAMAERARELGNLALFVDAPEPFKIMASLQSVSSGVTDLFKPFYEKRKEYKLFKSDELCRQEVTSFVKFLLSETWPTTIYPSLPWSTVSNLLASIPNLDVDSVFGVNLDYQIIEDIKTSPREPSLSDHWVVDYPRSKWSEQIEYTLKTAVSALRPNPWLTEEEIEERISQAVGTLISVHRNYEPWWSPFIAKSLALGRPVVTDWRYTNELGQSWNLLASGVEGLSPQERHKLSQEQLSVYQSSVEGQRENLFTALSQVASRTEFVRV